MLLAGGAVRRAVRHSSLSSHNTSRLSVVSVPRHMWTTRQGPVQAAQRANRVNMSMTTRTSTITRVVTTTTAGKGVVGGGRGGGGGGRRHQRASADAAGSAGSAGGRGQADETSRAPWLVLVPIGIAIALYVGYWGQWALRTKKKREWEKEAARIAEEEASASTVGGDFQLEDQFGRPQNAKSLLEGNWTLLYFGYTQCPDVCPREMKRMTAILNHFEESRGVAGAEAPDAGEATAAPARPPLVGVMVTVDPDRDSKQRMRDYLKDYHPRLIGLTGTKGRVAEMINAYRIYSHRSEAFEDAADVKASTKEEFEQQVEQQDYLIDHSILFLLMGPNGKYVKFYPSDLSVEDIVEDIDKRMKALEQDTT